MFRLAGLLIFTGVMNGQIALTVRVWDYANVPRPVLISAQTETAYLFEKAGVQIAWLECNPKRRVGAGCEVPHANDIILRIQPHSALQGASGADILGRAIGEQFTDVYDAEVTQAALTQNVPRNQVYAMAITHELGHLLLGPGAHTATGIMRPRWDAGDFDAASQRRLRFAPRQCQVIRAAAGLRSTPQPTLPTIARSSQLLPRPSPR